MRAHAAIASLCLVLCASPLAGTSTSSETATLTGVVADERGGPLPGVTVTLRGPVPPDRTTTTDANGRFSIPGLAAGRYAARFELAGFQSQTAEILIEQGRSPALTIAMKIEALEETITVSASAVGMWSSSAVASGLGTRRLDHAGLSRESYRYLAENGFRRVDAHPLSTFSLDADTASYANVRRFLNEGELPPEGAVRIEELINYFSFDYAPPAGDAPVALTTELARCPWNEQHLLALVGLRAKDMRGDAPPARNLVFLLDVSGSMDSPDKLPLVQKAMHMLVERLTERDRVGIVVYAGSSGLALSSTSGADKESIHAAIARLRPGGSTNGAEGMVLAYRIARAQFTAGGVNRVILATDGDFNVGVTSEDRLVRLIERERKSGVFLTVLGVGTGNLQDSTMEALADKGNGNYAYLDSVEEARKVLVRESDATLVTVARDVMIQIEFNPRKVSGYRLIGYENRLLDDQDFNDHEKDAGEIGAGHTVTALYEIVPAGVIPPGRDVGPLKYQRRAGTSRASRADELMTIKVAFKRPEGGRSQRFEMPVSSTVDPLRSNLGFASAVAEYGMLLRRSQHLGLARFERALERARQFRGDDPDGDRTEFIALAEKAWALYRRNTDDAARGPGARESMR